MAYVVPRPKGRWELRRSMATAAGPRSETLLSFGELTEEGIAQAVAHSGGRLSADQVREAALRAGAPVALPSSLRPAAELLGELARGASLPSSWRRALLEALAGDGPTDAAEAIGRWAGASAEQRGAALRDLLLLADAIPPRASRQELAFPGFSTGER